jgi:hypothetical protein
MPHAGAARSKEAAVKVKAAAPARPAARASPERGGTELWQRLALFVQPKLRVSAPNDPAEAEADRIADTVMRMPEPAVQRKCAACSEGGTTCPSCEEEAGVQRKADGANGAGKVSSNIASRLGSGTPLPAESRAFFEPRFGQDFSGVRLHTGSASAEVANSLHAKAFTTGNHIVFGKGRYEPGSGEGKKLLAHELTHVVQQGGVGDGSQVAQPMIQMSRDCDQEHIECFRDCWRRKPPWPIDKGGSGHYRYCSALCLAEYMECIGEEAVERAFDSMSDALQWLSEHPEVVVGTLVIVAGVTFVVATGGSGALILVPAAL